VAYEVNLSIGQGWVLVEEPFSASETTRFPADLPGPGYKHAFSISSSGTGSPRPRQQGQYAGYMIGEIRLFISELDNFIW
jgi:hypothetical protein